MRWPWRRGIEDAEKRLAVADRATADTPALASYSRALNDELQQVVALNGFGKAVQVAMKGRHA